MGKFVRITSTGVLRSYDETSSTSIYDETYTAVTTISAGTAVTLPNSGTYTGSELEVYFRGQRLDDVLDYNYVGGSAPRTQVTFTFDLEATDTIKFRVDRSAS